MCTPSIGCGSSPAWFKGLDMGHPESDSEESQGHWLLIVLFCGMYVLYVNMCIWNMYSTNFERLEVPARDLSSLPGQHFCEASVTKQLWSLH